MQFRIKYGDEFEPVNILDRTKDALGQEYCVVQLVDDPRVILEVKTEEIKIRV